MVEIEPAPGLQAEMLQELEEPDTNGGVWVRDKRLVKENGKWKRQGRLKKIKYQ